MATIITITKDDTKDSIKKKVEAVGDSSKFINGLDAKKFTGKIKSFGDGLDFQRKLRNEWN
ncbi:hypothetical protein [Parafilimonas terrae]|uniref:Uncharacterized protein n=1 Tax=Parafilimonas terrae TaxID=1465490 RepID=A0A1I5ZBU3_9BACT|nr:hypothetical protein [Parafilimonas terrae]SFQ53976.1 hypothetical protein SAMN05444277_1197 [Parafilimonas terrae]